MLKRYINQPTHLWFALATICVGYVDANILVFSATDSHKVEQGFRDLPARFGSLIPAEGVKGLVVYAEPSTACVDIKGPPNSSEYDGNNWIVLIARLNCSFEDKIRNAQKAGYDAAIVHNVNSDELEPMSAKDQTNITIPSVFVSAYTGSFLRNVYNYQEGYFILINDLPLNINTHLLLPFAIVVGICFLTMVTFMIVRCIKDRRRARRHRLPNSSLKKIPIHKYTKGDPYETCAICLEDYVDNEKLRVLPCAHAYHAKCIDPWLTKNRRVCPVCKRKVFAADERVETDSESDSDADDSTPLIREGSSAGGRGPGTQGGTFASEHEHPISSFWSEVPRSLRVVDVIREDDDEPLEIDDDAITDAIGAPTTRGHVFMVSSDCHSINGELPDFERSVSSTRPHTVNLSVEVIDENSRADITHHGDGRRHSKTAVPVAGASHQMPEFTVPRTSDDDDLII